MANVSVPDKVAELFAEQQAGKEMPRWATEAILVEAVREGRISRGYFRETLNLDFSQSEELLASKGVTYEMTADEILGDLAVATQGVSAR